MRRLRRRRQPESTETLPFLYYIKLVTLDVTPRAMVRAVNGTPLFFQLSWTCELSERTISGGNSFKTRDTLNVGAHRSDKLIDLYTKKMWECHSPEISEGQAAIEIGLEGNVL